jgi:hypothetical protein
MEEFFFYDLKNNFSFFSCLLSLSLSPVKQQRAWRVTAKVVKNAHLSGIS